METLEHLDADSEADAISDIQPVQNVMPNVLTTPDYTFLCFTGYTQWPEATASPQH